MAHKKKNRKLRFVISCVLSFLLAAFLTVGTALVAIQMGFLSENSVLDGLGKNDYYSSVEENFYQDAQDFTIPIGLPTDVVNDIVDSEKIYDDVNQYVTATVHNQAFAFDTDDLESRLTKNVYAYFNSQNQTMTEEQRETLPEYTRLIANIYVENIQFNYVNLLGKVNTSYGKYLWIGAIVCFVLGIGIVVLLISMYHWKHRALRFVTYSAIATGMMVASPAIIVAILERFMKPNIASEHLYYALVNYCESGLRIFVYFALGWAAVVAALLLGIRYLKKNS